MSCRRAQSTACPDRSRQWIFFTQLDPKSPISRVVLRSTDSQRQGRNKATYRSGVENRCAEAATVWNPHSTNPSKRAFPSTSDWRWSIKISAHGFGLHTRTVERSPFHLPNRQNAYRTTIPATKMYLQIFPLCIYTSNKQAYQTATRSAKSPI